MHISKKYNTGLKDNYKFGNRGELKTLTIHKITQKTGTRLTFGKYKNHAKKNISKTGRNTTAAYFQNQMIK